MTRRGGCLVWGLGVGAVLFVAAVTGVLVGFGYFGPDLPEADDVAEWRALGARAWGVDEAGDWSAVRAIIEKLDAAETAAGAPPVRRVDGTVDRPLSYEEEDADDRVPAAIAAMRASGMFEDVAALPEARPLHDEWDGGVNGAAAAPMMEATLGDLSAVRRLARIERVVFDEAVAAGDDAEAVRSFGRIMTLSEVMGRQPVLISRLVAIAIREFGMGHAVERAHDGELPAAVLEGVQHRLRSSVLPSAVMVFEAERIFSRNALRTQLPGGPLILTNPAAQFEPIDEFYDAVIAALDEEPRTAMVLLDDAWDAAGERHRLLYPMVHVLLPAVTRAATVEFGTEVRARASVVALALERHRLRTGSFPDSLDALVSAELDEVPSDPFHESGFIYRVGEAPTATAADGGCVLYSVGYDNRDDGGTPAGPRDNAFSMDADGVDEVVFGPGAFE